MSEGPSPSPPVILCIPHTPCRPVIDSGGVVSSMHSGLQALCLQTVQQEVLKLQQRRRIANLISRTGGSICCESIASRLWCS